VVRTFGSLEALMSPSDPTRKAFAQARAVATRLAVEFPAGGKAIVLAGTAVEP
jgi:hypothetical protein